MHGHSAYLISMHRVKNIVTYRAIFLRAGETSRRRRTSYIIRALRVENVHAPRSPRPDRRNRYNVGSRSVHATLYQVYFVKKIRAFWHNGFDGGELIILLSRIKIIKKEMYIK